MTKPLGVLFTSLIVTSLLAEPSFAARPAKRKIVVPPPPTTFSVSVPRGEIDVGSQLEKEEDRPLPAYELAVSSWTPRSFYRGTYSGTAAGFERSGLPSLGLTRIAPIRWWSNGAAFSWKVGLGLVNLEREGFLSTQGVRFYGTQSLSLVSVRAGIEYQALTLLGGLIQPYVGFSVLPTLALSSRSQLEEKVNEVGFPFEATGGLLVRPGFLKDFGGFRQGAIGLGALYTFGSVGESNLRGYGLQGLVRFSL